MTTLGGARRWAPAFIVCAVVIAGCRYNQVQQKSTHNSYQRHEALLDQFGYHQVRSIELDIHRTKTGQSTRSGDWFVYHASWDPGTTCNRLSNCLDEVAAWHNANPNHEVITVFLDLKSDWQSGGWNPSNLDTLLNNKLGSAIYRPSHINNACSGNNTLQKAVTGNCAWPDLEDMQGRVVFALTGGDSKLTTYAGSSSTAYTRRAFIAPNNNSGSSNHGSWTQAVFFNLNSSSSSWTTRADSVRNAGLVSRAWGVNSSGRWNSAKADVHHIATDKVNYHQDSWAKTHSSITGYPFTPFGGNPDDYTEDIRTLRFTINSGDIWGSSDSFAFANIQAPADAFSRWSVAVNSANSHTEDWAKGCLMARRYRTSNSPYFAVCRPADDHKLRIQWRSTAGGGTSSTEGNDIVPQDEGEDAIDDESITFVRLTVQKIGSQWCAKGEGSQNRVNWVQIGSQRCYNHSLQYQGIAASSHDGGTLQFRFGNVRRQTGNTITLPNANNFTVTRFSAPTGWIKDGY